MGLVQQKPGGQTGAAGAIPAPQVSKIKKGTLIFAEGENSKAMYILKAGIIRIYKKKGTSQIEIGTIHSGEILGELAFLDGNPRSASAEALTDCELMEISGVTFAQTLAKIPDWLKMLLKTIVGRLRTASTRIRQLESASTAVDYSDGKRNTNYVFLSQIDALKICSAILCVAARNGKQEGPGLAIKMLLVNRYANQIIGVPLAKITAMIDVLVQIGIVQNTDPTGATTCTVTDMNFLEQMIAYMNEQNLLEPQKRTDVTLRGFFIMGLMSKHLSKYPKQADGTARINLAEIRKIETASSGREPFRLEEVEELVKIGLTSTVEMKSGDEVNVVVNVENFLHTYRMQRAIKALAALNEQKQKAA